MSKIIEVKQVAELLEESPPSPTLQEQIAEQQRVIEGLREEKDKYQSAAKEWRIKYEEVAQSSRERADVILRLESENESLLDKFGPIDEAECKAAEAETALTRIAQKAERMAEILIELNEAIL